MKNGVFELSDCKAGGFFDNNYKGKVLVLSPDFLQPEHKSERGQLWLGTGGVGCEPGEAKKKLTAIHLHSGLTAEFRRGQFYGMLHPYLLPDWARISLGGLPVSERALEWNSFTGFCPLPDGSYGKDVPLADWQDVMDFIRIQKDYQSQVDITDSEGYVILTLKNGMCEIDPDLLLDACDNQSIPQTSALKLKDTISIGLLDSVYMYLAHDATDVGFVSAGWLARMDEKERATYSELLNADIKEIRPGAYGPEIVLTGISPQALTNYDRAASGHARLINEDQAVEPDEGQGESIQLT